MNFSKKMLFLIFLIFSFFIKTGFFAGFKGEDSRYLPENAVNTLHNILENIKKSRLNSTYYINETYQNWLENNSEKITKDGKRNLLHLLMRIRVRDYASFNAKYCLIFDLFYKYKIDPKIGDMDGDSPLHLFVTMGDKTFSKENISEVGSIIHLFRKIINERNKSGSTPLHISSRLSNFEMMEALIKNGANIRAINSYQQTPLHCLVKSDLSESKKLKALRLLSGYTGLASNKDRLDRTALHWAAIKNGVNSEVYRRIKDMNRRCERSKDFFGRRPSDY